MQGSAMVEAEMVIQGPLMVMAQKRREIMAMGVGRDLPQATTMVDHHLPRANRLLGPALMGDQEHPLLAAILAEDHRVVTGQIPRLAKMEAVEVPALMAGLVRLRVMALVLEHLQQLEHQGHQVRIQGPALRKMQDRGVGVEEGR
jgi:hypothetical protein